MLMIIRILLIVIEINVFRLGSNNFTSLKNIKSGLSFLNNYSTYIFVTPNQNLLHLYNLENNRASTAKSNRRNFP